MSILRPNRSKGNSHSGPYGVLSRLYFKALANLGQKPQDISTFVRMYVAKRANTKRTLSSDGSHKPPSEAAIQQEVQTVLRAIHGERMTLKTLLQAVQVVGATEVEISITLKFPTGMSVTAVEVVSTEQPIEDYDNEQTH